MSNLEEYLLIKDIKECNKDISKEEENVLQPMHYAATTIGCMSYRKFFQNVVTAVNYWLDIPQEKLLEISDLIIEQASISFVLDDIQDNMSTRQGYPATHEVFGVDRTLSAGNYAMALSFKRFGTFGGPQATDVVKKFLMEAIRGQGKEVYWRDNFICPTEQEYMEMAREKTGALVCMTAKMLQLYSNNQTDFNKIFYTFGTFAQIYNDTASLISKKYTEARCYCEDITEGKFSFPVVHAIQSHPEDDIILNILKQRTTDNELKKHCVSLLEKYGSIDYAKEMLEKLRGEMIEEMKNVGDNQLFLQIVDEIIYVLCEGAYMIL